MSKELLFSITKKDFDVQTFRCSGPGGQNVNKVETGVRIVHRESGAVGESREERKQGQNKKIAFARLVKSPVFQAWHKQKANKLMAVDFKIEIDPSERIRTYNFLQGRVTDHRSGLTIYNKLEEILNGNLELLWNGSDTHNS